MNSKNILLAMAASIMMLSACTKDALDKKTNINLTVPTTIDDYQQLIDGLQGGVVNSAPGLFSYLTIGDYLSDDVYLTDNSYNNFFKSAPYITGLYKWDKNFVNSTDKVVEWNVQYQNILNANVVLEGIERISQNADNQLAYNNVKGSALLIRGQMFFNLAQFWAKPYHSASASTDIGIVLRTSSEAATPTVRSSVAQTYVQIIADLSTAAELLPNTSNENTRVSKVRASKAGAYGLLARTYLVMGDYSNALKYSNLALTLYSSLLDYASLSSSSTFRFFSVPNFHSEIVYYTADGSGSVGETFGFWNVKQSLFDAYSANDLRKQYFFNPSLFYGLLFSGDYSGERGGRFTGIAVDELYLIRSESYIRTGNVSAGVADINTLLSKRWKSGTYIDFSTTDATVALTRVLEERRKELIGRGLRWTDLRRLNMDPRFAVTLSRSLLGTTYTLPPNDSRYTLQVPSYIVSASNGNISQTP